MINSPSTEKNDARSSEEQKMAASMTQKERGFCSSEEKQHSAQECLGWSDRDSTAICPAVRGQEAAKYRRKVWCAHGASILDHSTIDLNGLNFYEPEVGVGADFGSSLFSSRRRGWSQRTPRPLSNDVRHEGCQDDPEGTTEKTESRNAENAEFAEEEGEEILEREPGREFPCWKQTALSQFFLVAWLQNREGDIELIKTAEEKERGGSQELRAFPFPVFSGWS